MSEEGKAFPHSEAGNSVADLSGNGAAVGDGSVCVFMWGSLVPPNFMQVPILF